MGFIVIIEQKSSYILPFLKSFSCCPISSGIAYNALQTSPCTFSFFPSFFLPEALPVCFQVPYNAFFLGNVPAPHQAGPTWPLGLHVNVTFSWKPSPMPWTRCHIAAL